MTGFEQIPQPKNEIAGTLDELCLEQECELQFHQGHLQDEVTWIIKPVAIDREINLRSFAQELLERLNLNETNEYHITVDDVQGTDPYIRIEKLTNE